MTNPSKMYLRPWTTDTNVAMSITLEVHGYTEIRGSILLIFNKEIIIFLNDYIILYLVISKYKKDRIKCQGKWLHVNFINTNNLPSCAYMTVIQHLCQVLFRTIRGIEKAF